MDAAKRSQDHSNGCIVPKIDGEHELLPENIQRFAVADSGSAPDIKTSTPRTLYEQTPRSEQLTNYSTHLYAGQSNTIFSMSRRANFDTWTGHNSEDLGTSTQQIGLNLGYASNDCSLFGNDSSMFSYTYDLTSGPAVSTPFHSHASLPDEQTLLVNPADLQKRPDEQQSTNSTPWLSSDSELTCFGSTFAPSPTPFPAARALQPESHSSRSHGPAYETRLVTSGSHVDDTIRQSVACKSTVGDEPYNILLGHCLLEAPNYRRSLREIYKWFREKNPTRFRPNSKAWQNSIRHNLSMNEAFDKVKKPELQDGKKNVWFLEEEAIVHGVQPTTRFRHHSRKSTHNHRKSRPALKRQMSGAKGGEAARRSKRLRHGTSAVRVTDHDISSEQETSVHVTPAPDAVAIPNCSVRPVPHIASSHDYNRHSSPYFSMPSTNPAIAPVSYHGSPHPCYMHPFDQQQQLLTSATYQLDNNFLNQFPSTKGDGNYPLAQQTQPSTPWQQPGIPVPYQQRHYLDTAASSTRATPDPSLFYESEDDREQSTQPATPVYNEQFYFLGLNP